MTVQVNNVSVCLLDEAILVTHAYGGRMTYSHETCICTAVPKDMQLARRIRGPIAGVSSY